jgi:hypothetical protein
MARVVVVASSEVDRGILREVVTPDDELIVVVPAVEQSRLEWLTNDEGGARSRASEVGEAIERDAPGEASTVEVKPDAPGQLVRDAIAEHDPDRIVLAVREGEDATWLEEGELGEIPSEVAGVPVTRVSI